MIANYHTHTFRCGHAVGTDREYVENAIKSGIKILGFSDHAPYTFEDGHISCWRIPKEKEEDYVNSITALKEEYKNDIEIHLGYEMEYYPKEFNDMYNYVKNLKAEYLILGQHNLGETEKEFHPTPVPCDDINKLNKYTELITEAIKTEKFLYVAHPDIFRFTGKKEIFYNALLKIANTAKEYNMPLEINFLGIRDNRHYPSATFFEACRDSGCKVIFGADAHDPKDLVRKEDIEKAEKIVKDYNLNLVETLKI